MDIKLAAGHENMHYGAFKCLHCDEVFHGAHAAPGVVLQTEHNHLAILTSGVPHTRLALMKSSTAEDGGGPQCAVPTGRIQRDHADSCEEKWRAG